MAAFIPNIGRKTNQYNEKGRNRQCGYVELIRKCNNNWIADNLLGVSTETREDALRNQNVHITTGYDLLIFVCKAFVLDPGFKTIHEMMTKIAANKKEGIVFSKNSAYLYSNV